MRFPSERQRLALERGASDLWELVKWHYRNRPAQLKRLHQAYARLCCLLYRALERRFDSGKRE
jgi:hypothetical protein